jgi:hypothetical protein
LNGFKEARMAVNLELTAFIKDGLQRGIPRSDLQDALQQAGWDGGQVSKAMRLFADVEFAIPVPRPTPYVDAREAFMYVLMFTTLYLSAYHLGSLAFDFINISFPDATAHEYARAATDASMRWAVSAIIVSFPVFLYVAWLIGREVSADATKRTSKARRQLTYLTMFLAAALLIGDVTTLLYNFLGGDLSVRFVLKILTVAAIAGSSFGYYLRELRHDERALAA